MDARELDPLFCDACEMQLTSQKDLMLHNRGKKHLRNVQRRRCDLCNIELMGDDALRAHLASPRHQKQLAKDQPDSAAVYCEPCQLACLSQKQYEEHCRGKRHLKSLAAAAGEPAAPTPGPSTEVDRFYCQVCAIGCTGPAQYAEHVKGKRHLKADATAWSCEPCGRKFPLEDNRGYSEHMQSRNHKITVGALEVSGDASDDEHGDDGDDGVSMDSARVIEEGTRKRKREDDENDGDAPLEADSTVDTRPVKVARVDLPVSEPQAGEDEEVGPVVSAWVSRTPSPVGDGATDESYLGDRSTVVPGHGLSMSDLDTSMEVSRSEPVMNKGKSEADPFLSLSLEPADVPLPDAEPLDDDRDVLTAPPPWAPNKNAYRHPNLAVNLHTEILDFCNYMGPTPAEKQMRLDVIDGVRKVVKKLWPAAELRVFGSHSTNLFLPTSDIDMVVDYPGLSGAGPLHRLASALQAADLVSKMQVIASARVPIIKFNDKRSQCPVDIAFNISDGLHAKVAVEKYLQELPPLRPLLFVVKFFLQQRSLNEVFTGGIGSYSLTVMIISLFQRRSYPVTQDSNLGLLLIEFFELYGLLLNYNTVGIDVTGGGSYFDKRRTEFFNGERPFLLCIKDPQNDSNDLGRNSYGIMTVRNAFEHAFKILTTTAPSRSGTTLLQRLFRVKDDLLAWRRAIAGMYEEENEVLARVAAAARDSADADDFRSRHKAARNEARDGGASTTDADADGDTDASGSNPAPKRRPSRAEKQRERKHRKIAKRGYA